MSKRRLSLGERRRLKRLKRRVRESTYRLNVQIYKRMEELRKDVGLIERIDGEIERLGVEKFKREAGELSRKEVLDQKESEMSTNC